MLLTSDSCADPAYQGLPLRCFKGRTDGYDEEPVDSARTV